MLAAEGKYMSANRRRTLRLLGKYVRMYAYTQKREGDSGRLEMEERRRKSGRE
jgi:hypothetical protein